MTNKPWAGVARLGGLGDNLIASSILPLLAKDYHVEVICQDPHHVVFENNPHIDKLTVKKAGDLPSSGAYEWQEWFAKRAKEYAKFVHLTHTVEITLALVKAQTQFYWPAKMRRRLCGASYLEFIHDLAEVPYEFAPDFFPVVAERIKAEETLAKIEEPVIAWVVSGSRLDKIYPPSAMVVARLIKEAHASVIMFGGGAKDLQIGQYIEEVVERQNGSKDRLHAAISPAGEVPERWPLRRSLTLVQHCDLVIGPDTGLMWAVAMHGMPKIVLLSHASPANITKHWVNTDTLHADQTRVPCWPCHQLHDTTETCTPNKDGNGAACISDINPNVIVDAAQRALAAPRVRLVA